MDWTELIEAFLAAKQHAFASNTRRAYRYDLMACAQVLPTLPVREITVSHLRLFLDATTYGQAKEQIFYFQKVDNTHLIP